MDYSVLLYYKFVAIDDPQAFADGHRALCQALGLRGRILVAEEGLNGTVSGTRASCDRYMHEVHADPRFADMAFKVDPAEGHAFRKLFVRPRSEIITLEREADPRLTTGEHLAPAQFRQELEDPDVIVLDGRNAYESEVGRFRNAVCPQIENFREFPEWLEEHLGHARDRRILTYCTGGIRCEKLTSLMIGMGFQNVAQLDGGIVTYGKDDSVRGEGFDGLCYVFDERVAVPVNRTEDASLITKCRFCGETTDYFPNCANTRCNLQFASCKSCYEAQDFCCSQECAQAEHRREPGGKLRAHAASGRPR